MSDMPYAIIADGNGGVMERKLAYQSGGVPLAATVTVVSNTVVGGVRTVVLNRALNGATTSHYTFDPTLLTLDFIAATGQAASFGECTSCCM